MISSSCEYKKLRKKVTLDQESKSKKSKEILKKNELNCCLQRTFTQSLLRMCIFKLKLAHLFLIFYRRIHKNKNKFKIKKQFVFIASYYPFIKKKCDEN